MFERLLVLALGLNLAVSPALASEVPAETTTVSAHAQSSKATDVWKWGILIPGLGHVMLGEPLIGAGFFSLATFFATVGTIAVQQEYAREHAPCCDLPAPPLLLVVPNSVFAGVLFGGLTLGTWVLSVASAQYIETSRATTGSDAGPKP